MGQARHVRCDMPPDCFSLLFESDQSFDDQWKSCARVVEVVIASPIMFFRRQRTGSSSIGWHLRPRSCAVVTPDDRNLLILRRNSTFLGSAVSVGNSSAYS
jgi:hypothetical protein